MQTFSEHMDFLLEANDPELRAQFELGIPKTVISHDMADKENKTPPPIPNTPTYIPGVTNSDDIYNQFANGFINSMNGHDPYN